MARSRAALVILGVGLLTFSIVFSLLQLTRSGATAGQAASAPAPDLLRDNSSPGSMVAAGTTVVGVPTTGSELLLRDVQPGDRLDVLASLASPRDNRPVTAVIVRGATVLVPATSSDPLLLQVSPPDALALAHLLLGGTRLGYVVWSANGAIPPETQPLDEQAARALLGLAPTASQQPEASPSPTTPPVAQPTLTPLPIATPSAPSSGAPRAGGFLYQVQDGDTWESIAATFSLSVAEVKHWNETSADQDLAPRTLLFIPT